MSEFRWQPEAYLALMREEIPDYERLQQELVAATAGVEADAILELGVGTGETTRRVLDAHPGALLHGLDGSDDMLDAARAALAGRPVALTRARLEDPLPAGPFDLVVSALAVHHLEGPAKADLFARARAALRPGGRFVLADVVVPDDPRDAVIPLDEGYDLPSPVADQLVWLAAAGFENGRVTWRRRDLAVLAGERAGGAR